MCSVTFRAGNKVQLTEEKWKTFNTVINLDILPTSAQSVDHLISNNFLPTASRRDSSPKNVTIKEPTVRECSAPLH